MLSVKEWHDQDSWDKFVASQKSCHYNQSWAWGEAAGPLGGTIHRYAIVDGESIRCALSVVANPIRKSKRRQLYVSRGPVVDAPTPDVFRLVDQTLRDLGESEGAIGAKVEPHVAAGDPLWTSLLKTEGYAPLYPPSQPRSTWVLDLEPDLDQLLGAMKSKWRYNIRLAEKRKVEIVHAVPADTAEFYRIYQETAQRDDFFIHPESFYRFIFDQFHQAGQLQLILAYHQSELLAAVSLVHVGATVWYLYGASTNKNRELMAPHLLQWEAIKWAQARGAAVYDFRGVPDVPAPGQEMYGVYRFKQGFGGRHVSFLDSYVKGYHPVFFQMWRSYWRGRFAIQAVKRRMRGLPQRQWA